MDHSVQRLGEITSAIDGARVVVSTTAVEVHLAVAAVTTRLAPEAAAILAGLLGRAASALTVPEPLPPHDGYRIGGRHDTIDDDPEIMGIITSIMGRLRRADADIAAAYDAGRRTGRRWPGNRPAPRPGWRLLDGGATE